MLDISIHISIHTSLFVAAAFVPMALWAAKSCSKRQRLRSKARLFKKLRRDIFKKTDARVFLLEAKSGERQTKAR